jgi:nucleoside-diphosphate-sugar epimerase
VRNYFQGRSVLVTGGTGFIGRSLVNALLEQGASVNVLSRHIASTENPRCKAVMGDLTAPASLIGLCRKIDTVFHLGGYAHAVDDIDGKSEEMLWRVTVDGTRALIEKSRENNVRRFILVSSVKAMGEGGESCLDETADTTPVTSYGRAKYEAEKLVLDAGHEGMSSTILRLPMVYGPGCKGNLPRMIQAIARGRFPSLLETGNKRSMVDVRDVVQAALLAATSSAAAGEVYIVTDGQTYSTRQIYECICEALQLTVPRWTVPLPLLRIAARVGDIFGRMRGRRFMFDTSALDKLIGSACYSSSKITRDLGYQPSFTLKSSLPAIVAELHRNG